MPFTIVEWSYPAMNSEAIAGGFAGLMDAAEHDLSLPGVDKKAGLRSSSDAYNPATSTNGQHHGLRQFLAFG
jgi:hypothetical protein